MEYQPKDDPEFESRKAYYMWYASNAEDAVAYRKEIAKTIEEYKKEKPTKKQSFKNGFQIMKKLLLKLGLHSRG